MEQKVWKLILNHMKDSIEKGDVVAWSEDKNILLKWYNSNRTKPYVEIIDYGRFGIKHWNKTFAKESILEWYNAMNDDGTPNIYGHGLHYENRGLGWQGIHIQE